MRATGENKQKNIGVSNKLNKLFTLIIFVIILIFVNILSESIPWKYDMTFEKIFSLSEQTYKILNDLDRNVSITAFYREGKEDATVKALLAEYVKNGGGKIDLQFADADTNPLLAKKFDENNEGIFNETIIFESKGNIKKVTGSDIYSLNDAYGKSFSGEQQFTGAILYVSSPDLSKIYFLEGHQETSLEEDLFKLKSKIESEASMVESLNLIKSAGIPDDADILVVVSPKRDLSSEEKAMLQLYLSKGGKAMFLFDVLGPDNELTNFMELLEFYGIGIKNNFIIEEDEYSFYSNNKMFLVPYYESHEIVEGLNSENLAIIFPYTLRLEKFETDDTNLIIDPLLKTSDVSWARYNITEGSPSKIESDISGPCVVAYAVTRDNTDDRFGDTRIIVTGNAKFIENNMLDIQGNIDFFINSANWVQGKKDSIVIRPKMMNSNRMMVRGLDYIILLIVSVVLIPMAAFGTGLIIWLKRRHA
ncbi:MAG: GldG family protein [Clostridiaceae bacterium]|nr:GldG family protein [Clostridiaceae bacterium]